MRVTIPANGSVDLEGMRANTRWLLQFTKGKDFIYIPLGSGKSSTLYPKRGKAPSLTCTLSEREILSERPREANPIVKSKIPSTKL